MHQVHGILVLAAFLAISSYASYKTLPWGVKELVRKQPHNNYGYVAITLFFFYAVVVLVY